jgi:dipeptidyl-peptidase-4
MSRTWFALLLATTCLAGVQAQELPKIAGEIPFERLYQYPILNGRSPAAPAMSPNGRHIVFGWNQTGVRKLDAWIMDYPSGEKRRIIEAAKIEELPRQDDTRTQLVKDEAALYDGGISGFTWAPDSQEFLFTYKGRTFRSNVRGEFEPLVDAAEGMYGFKYSPSGRYIGYLKGSNVYRMDRRTGLVKQLTFVGKPGATIDSFDWSPDSKWIAISWSDSSRMGRHVMMDFSKDRAEVVNIQRLWHGDQSWDSQYGLVSAEGGLIKFVSGIPRYNWGMGVSWSPDSSRFAIGWMSQDFMNFNITVVPTSTGQGYSTYQEKAPKNYLNDWRPMTWTRDGSKILLGTDVVDGKFSNRSVLAITPNGKDVTKVYAENHDVVAMTRPKNSDRLVLVTMARTQLTTEITIVEPNGTRTVHNPMPDGFATPSQFDEASDPLVSEDGKSIATLCSNRKINNELYSVEPSIKRLTQSQLPEFNKIKWANFEPVTFKMKDGETINAVLITKPGLDKSKKHPAFLSNMYANSAKLTWGGYLENYAAMELGMVVLLVDFRSSWGRGGEFNSGYYKSLGVIDADEAVAAKDYLVSLGYVNPDRCGVWGWSYGGFLTCMIQLTKPGVFDTGVAVASVTDWKSYNEWYTRRRLGMEKDDPEVYKKTSPVHHAAGLKDNLYLIHGMLDDNVLYQDTARLIQQLVEKGKPFDMLAYPRDDHSIGKDTSRPHVQAAIIRYLWQKLGRP